MSERAIAFVGSRVVLTDGPAGTRLPTHDELESAFGAERLSSIRVPVRLPGDPPIRTFDLDGSEDDLPAAFHLAGLRAAYHSLEPDDFRAAGAARQKVEWYRTTRFCSACGSSTAVDPDHEAMRCEACGFLHFPRLSPAVIVLVQRGREALLARSPRFDAGVYSTLAGFVEPGESLEECIHREIFEEVGVRVTNLRYFGSQPHPFPHSLMIGFVADWLDGAIAVDEREIEDARWFARDELPVLPHPMSIARALIEDFVRRGS